MGEGATVSLAASFCPHLFLAGYLPVSPPLMFLCLFLTVLSLFLTWTSHENSLPEGKPSELAQRGAQPLPNKHETEPGSWLRVWAH